MNRSYILIVIFVLGIFACLNVASAAPSNLIHVNPNGNDLNNGMSENSSKATLSNAIDSVGSQGTILLSSGIYKGEGNYNITINKNLTIKSTNITNKSIIDGQNLYNLININNGSIVRFENIVFTNAYRDTNGAAIYNSGDATFINCIFNNNFANCNGDIACSEGGRGAAIFNINGNLTVLDCSFTNNTGNMYGGAINNRFGEKIIINNSVFINNKAYSGGGAIDTNGGKYMLITNSLFIGNNLLLFNGLIGRDGGAIVNKESNLIVNYCAFYNNYDYYGNTIFNNAGSTNADFNFWGTNDNISSLYRGFNVNNYYKLLISPTVANNTLKIGDNLNYNTYFALNTDGSKKGIENLPIFNISVYNNGKLLGEFSTKNTPAKTTKLMSNVSTLTIKLFNSTVSSYGYKAKKVSNTNAKTHKPDLKIVKIVRKNNKYYIKVKNIGIITSNKNYLGVYSKGKLISKIKMKSLKKGSSTVLKLTFNKKYLKLLKKFKVDYKNQVNELIENNNIAIYR